MKFYCPPNPQKMPLPEPTFVVKPISKVVDDVVVRSFERTQIDPSTINEGLKSSDFYVETLLENNALDLLKPNLLKPIGEKLSVASAIEKLESYE